MGSKIFVGGLAWATTDDTLRAAFEHLGEVTESKVIIDRDSGRSRGFGFVSFADASACQEAVATMDGVMIDGRNVRVNEAQERQGGGGGGPRTGRPAGVGGGGGGRGRAPTGGGRERW